MDYSIIEVAKDKRRSLHIGELYAALGQVNDKRQGKGKRYTMEILLIVVILAKLCGENTLYGIAEWAKMRGKQLQNLFGYHHHASPRYKTIQRLADTSLEDRELQMVTRRYLHQTYGGSKVSWSPSMGKPFEERYQKQKGEVPIYGHVPPLPQTVVAKTVEQSGRIETRRLTAIPEENNYLQWTGLNTVFKLERHVFQPQKGKEWSQVVFGVTSLTYTPLLAKRLLTWTRQHWGIENKLHYRRDVTLHEDGTQMKQSHQAQVLATLNNF